MKEINSEREYQKALERLNEIIDAKMNTPEGDDTHKLRNRI